MPLEPGPWSPQYLEEQGYPSTYDPFSRTIPGGGGFDIDAFLDFMDAQGGGGGGGGYVTPFAQTEAGMQLGGQQAMEQIGMQGQLAGQQAAAQQGYAFEQLSITGQQAQQAAAKQQQYQIQLMGIQQEFNKLEGEKNRAFEAGENEKAREFEARQEKLRQAFQSLEAEKDRDFQAAEAELGREFQREMQNEQLKMERQMKFAETMGTDPVRAVLMASGYEGELIPGGGKYGGLPPLAGAQQYERMTEKALGGVLGREGVDISAKGVTGIGKAEQAATAYQRGGGGAKTLLTSAFGVGEGMGGGLKSEEFVQRVQDVTPTGVLQG